MSMNSLIWWGELVAFAAALGAFISLFFNPARQKTADFLIRHLFWEFAGVWALGVTLYSVGYNWSGSEGDFFATVPRAVMSSFEMFLFESDVHDLSEACEENRLFMVVFSLTHFAAVLLTSLFILKVIGFRGRAFMHLLKYARLSRKREHLNIFWGTNEASFILAANIHRHAAGRNAIVFVVQSDEQPGHSASHEGAALHSLLNLRSMEETDIERLTAMNAYVTLCGMNLARLDGQGGSDLFGRLRLKLLRRIILQSPAVRIFLLSDNEQENIQCALRLLKDQAALPSRPTTIYVHARRTCQEVLDNEAAAAGSPVRLRAVDSSYLCIASLKQQPEYHPVRFVAVDTAQAAVTSPFSALLVGFGQTGQEALDFLYEFSAFIAPDGKKSPARYCAIDRQMETLSGGYFLRRPAMKSDPSIELFGAAIGSEPFWGKVEELLPALNYVVIATGEDEQSIALAAELYRQACRAKRNDLSHFKIFVRCYTLENFDRMQKIAAVCNANNRAASGGGEIILFGDPRSLYTYPLIIDDCILQQAKEFHKVYKEVQPDPERGGKEALWQQAFGPEGVARAAKAAGSRLFAMQRLNREMAQNIADCLHMPTKFRLLDIADADTGRHWYEITRTRPADSIDYPSANEAEALKLLNLAKCEHLRWEAAHRIWGYIPGAIKSEVEKTHPCLCTWEELTVDTQRYDCCVVDTSLKIVYGPGPADDGTEG